MSLELIQDILKLQPFYPSPDPSLQVDCGSPQELVSLAAEEHPRRRLDLHRCVVLQLQVSVGVKPIQEERS